MTIRQHIEIRQFEQRLQGHKEYSLISGDPDKVFRERMEIEVGIAVEIWSEFTAIEAEIMGGK